MSAVVVLELRCCCCGKLIDTRTTPWLLADVRPETIWTRQPCAPCEVQLAAEERKLAAERVTVPADAAGQPE